MSCTGRAAGPGPGQRPPGRWQKPRGEQVVQGLAVLIALLELRRFRLELGVGEALVLLFQGFDLLDDGLKAFDFLGHVGAKQFG